MGVAGTLLPSQDSLAAGCRTARRFLGRRGRELSSLASGAVGPPLQRWDKLSYTPSAHDGWAQAGSGTKWLDENGRKRK